MKVNPIHTTPPTYPFKGKVSSKSFGKTKEFLEAAGVVVGTSLPMFMFIYLPKAFKKIFKDKKEG